jgi:hypothetical protein
VPVATRDLASFELWERSLERSQRRRVLAEAARKQLMRRKTASVAMTAAVAAAPMAPSVSAAAALSKEGTAKLARKLERRHVDRVLLERGDSSSAVIELQRALRIPDDGIYGPQTQWAVETFQQREGLDVTGDVDVRTWLKLFPTDAVIYVAPAAAKAMGVDTGEGPSWTAVKASDVAATQAAASAAVASAPAPHRHHDASIARAAAALPKHAGKRGHEQPSGGDASSPIASPLHGDAPAPHGNAAPQVDQSPLAGSPPQASPVPKSEPFTPPTVPGGTAGEIIRELIGAANRIDARHFAYRWGGGHNSAFSGPYDCSGAVSAVLHAAGLLSRPMVSGDFAHWGARGRGAVTIYANAGHVYMSILGRYFGTSSANPGGGAGWFRGGPRPGFAVVHVPFEKLHLKARSATKKRSKHKSRRAHFRHGTSAGGVAADSMAAPPSGTTQASAPAAPQASPAPQSAPAAAPQSAPVAAQPVTQAQPVADQPVAAQPVAQAQPVQQAQPVAAQPVAQPAPVAVQPQAQPQPVAAQPTPQAPAATPAPVQAPASGGGPPTAGTPAAGTGAPSGEAPSSAAPADAAQPATSVPAPAAPAQPAATPAPPATEPAAGAQDPAAAGPADSSAPAAGATTPGSGN